jgi:nitroimidazol reductase NimA-like FMN-containing flavoprotein (pyridoxamine 5'-phosphate oxidase superfamily)
MSSPGGLEDQAWLEELPAEGCLALLRAASVGRIAFTVDDYPVVLPVNYRVIDTAGSPWLVIRTRPGNVIDAAPMRVALEIDGIDSVSRAGWSVLVRGNLHHTHPPSLEVRSHFDSHPWLAADRTSWLFVEPTVITGRRLHPPSTEWIFHMRAYL